MVYKSKPFKKKAWKRRKNGKKKYSGLKSVHVKLGHDVIADLPNGVNMLDGSNPATESIQNLFDIQAELGPYTEIYDMVKINKVKLTWTWDVNMWSGPQGGAITQVNPAITLHTRTDPDGQSLFFPQTVAQIRNSAKCKNFRPTADRNKYSRTYTPRMLAPIYTGPATPYHLRPVMKQQWMDLQSAGKVQFYGMLFGYTSSQAYLNVPIGCTIRVDYYLSFKTQLCRA